MQKRTISGKMKAVYIEVMKREKAPGQKVSIFRRVVEQTVNQLRLPRLACIPGTDLQMNYRLISSTRRPRDRRKLPVGCRFHQTKNAVAKRMRSGRFYTRERMSKIIGEDFPRS